MRRMPSRSNGGSEVEGGVKSRAERRRARLVGDNGENDARISPRVCDTRTEDCCSNSTKDEASRIGQCSLSCEPSAAVATDGSAGEV